MPKDPLDAAPGTYLQEEFSRDGVVLRWSCVHFYGGATQASQGGAPGKIGTFSRCVRPSEARPRPPRGNFLEPARAPRPNWGLLTPPSIGGDFRPSSHPASRRFFLAGQPSILSGQPDLCGRVSSWGDLAVLFDSHQRHRSGCRSRPPQRARRGAGPPGPSFFFFVHLACALVHCIGISSLPVLRIHFLIDHPESYHHHSFSD